MTSQHEVRAGQIITLRSQFKDDLGDTAEVTYPHLNIYDPTVEVYLPANATVASGIPTYLGDGIYSYDYTVPLSGPGGTWKHQWNGDLTVQRISALFSFDVTASGVIYELPSQLYNNNFVEVNIVSGLQALDGTSMDGEYSFNFLTTISPAYTSTRKMRLKVGAYIRNIPDDTLQLANLEASIEADALTWATTTSDSSLFDHARREYVTCLASYMLLQNTASNILRSKSLADLSVEYDTRGLQNTMDDLRNCMARWEPQVLSRGQAKKSSQPSMVIKGIYDPDRIAPARIWEGDSDGGVNRRIPATNNQQGQLYRRRYKKTYVKRWW